MQLTINIYNSTPIQTEAQTPTTTPESVPAVSSLNVFQPETEIDREYLKSLFDRELLVLKNKANLTVSSHYIKYLMEKYDR